MPCLLVVLILLFPRVCLALLYFFSNYLTGPYHNSILMLLLGFIFLPLTTLVYAWMFHSGMPVEGINLLYLMVAAIIDLGSMGGGYRHRRANSR